MTQENNLPEWDNNTYLAFQSEFIENEKGTRDSGAAEYAMSTDVFANFRRIASRLDKKPEEVLLVYALKHMDGIISHVNGLESQREPIYGRIEDLRNYLMILAAMFKARERQENPLADEVISTAAIAEVDDFAKFNWVAWDHDGEAYLYVGKPRTDKNLEAWTPGSANQCLRVPNFDFDEKIENWEDYIFEIKRTEPEKPIIKDWRDDPDLEGYNYFAIDSNGKAYAYLTYPTQIGGAWFGFWGKRAKLWDNPEVSNWKLTLQKRPILWTEEDHLLEKGFNYFAYDKNGKAYAYKNRPEIHFSAWGCSEGNDYYRLPEYDTYNDFGSWKVSLLSRFPGWKVDFPNHN